MKNFIVTNANELQNAIKVSQGGDKIVVSKQYNGIIQIQNIHKSATVTIESEDSTNPTVINGLRIQNSSGFAISNLEFFNHQALGYWFAIENSKSISLNKLEIHGRLNGSSQDDGGGMLIRSSENIKVENSNFYELMSGIYHVNNNDLEISQNSFYLIRNDGIAGGGTSNLKIVSNSFENFDHFGETHPDAIQLWTTGTTSSARNILIEGNTFVRGDGAIIQGIFMRDEVGGLPFQDLVVRNNRIAGAAFAGIHVANAENPLIEGNLVIGYPDQESWLSTRAIVGSPTLNNNAASVFKLAESTHLGSGNFRVVVTNSSDAEKSILNHHLNAWDNASITDLLQSSSGIGFGQLLGKSSVEFDRLMLSLFETSERATVSNSNADSDFHQISALVVGSNGADTFVDQENVKMTIQGGKGNDKYIVNNPNTIVSEDWAEGLDTVVSSVSYWLPDNVEYLQLSGHMPIYGIGNKFSNHIYGNDNNNFIDGGTHFDFLFGGGGNDILVGGQGNDTIDGGDGLDIAFFSGPSRSYVVGKNLEWTTITDYSGKDGIDSLLNIEFLRFSDGVFNIDGLLVSSSVEGPIIIDAGRAGDLKYNVFEGSVFVSTFSAISFDHSTEIEFEISDRLDGHIFEVNRHTGLLSFRKAPDFENFGGVGDLNVYTLDLVAKQGSAVAVKTVSIEVKDVNEAPVRNRNVLSVYNALEDRELVIRKTDLTSNYVDPEGDALSVFNLSLSIGSIVSESDSHIVIKAPVNFYGNVTLNFNMEDSYGHIIDAVEILSFLPANDEAIILGSLNAIVYSSSSHVGAIGLGRATGELFIIDPDIGENLFKVPSSLQLKGRFGDFHFDEVSGHWSYSVDNSRVETMKLSQDQFEFDTLTVESIDGTAKEDIRVQVFGVNDGALFGGDLEKDFIFGGDFFGKTELSGVVEVSDIDSLALVKTAVMAGDFGSFRINQDGSWSYSVDNSRSTILELKAEAGLAEKFQIRSADGTTSFVSINLRGVSEVTKGSDFSDIINGSDEIDRIFGLDGNDRILAGAGNDLVDGGVGLNFLDGGGGIDTISYASASSGVTVRLDFGRMQRTAADRADLLLGFENIIGSRFNDNLFGDASGNTISGGDGSDNIVGGFGADVLFGGSGRDRFIYRDISDSNLHATDTIFDFEKGIDRIDLREIDAVVGGSDDAFIFSGSTPQSFSVWAIASGENTYIYGDIDGDVSSVEIFIEIFGSIKFSASDFLL